MEKVNTLTAGQYFGEKSIEENRNRAATVIVDDNEELITATLTRTHYISVVGKAHRQAKEKEAELLRPFSALS